MDAGSDGDHQGAKFGPDGDTNTTFQSQDNGWRFGSSRDLNVEVPKHRVPKWMLISGGEE